MSWDKLISTNISINSAGLETKNIAFEESLQAKNLTSAQNQEPVVSISSDDVLGGVYDQDIDILYQAQQDYNNSDELPDTTITEESPETTASEEPEETTQKTIDELVQEAKEKIENIPVGTSFEDLSKIIESDPTFNSMALDQYLTKCGMQHGLTLSQMEDLYKLAWANNPEFAQRQEERQKLVNNIDEWNMLDEEIKQSTPITEENVAEIMDKFLIETEDDKEFFKDMLKQYDSELIETEDGKSIIRFKDEQGRPICDYTYGVEDGWTGRYKTVYTYAEDGSYKTQHYEQVCPHRQLPDGSTEPMGWMDDAVAYAPFYYDSDGNLIEKPTDADKDKFRVPFGAKRPLYEQHV